MKRLLIAAVLLLGLLAALSLLGVVTLPWGKAARTELCGECGMTRKVEGFWGGSADALWRTRTEPPLPTEVSLFLRQLGAKPCAEHLWRAYHGRRYWAGVLAVTLHGPRIPAATRLLAAEQVLARLDPALAREAVRARLARSEFDEAPGTPWWFSERGWPPADAGEARAWWAAAKRRW